MGIKISRKDLAQIVGARVAKSIQSRIEAVEESIRQKRDEDIFEKKVTAARSRLRSKKKIKSLLDALKAAGVEFEVVSNSAVDTKSGTLIVYEHVRMSLSLNERIKLTSAEVQKHEDHEKEIQDLRQQGRRLEQKAYDITRDEDVVSSYVSEMIISKDPELELLISSIESRIEADLTTDK